MRDYKFGNYITALRRKCGYTQYELGKLVGVSDKAVSKWENGTAKPSFDILISLSEILNISVEELLSCSKTINTCDDIQIVARKIFDKLVNKINQIYGNDIPIEVWNLYLEERYELEKCMNYAYFLYIISEVNDELTDVNILLSMPSTLITYLLGLTLSNPLPAHYLCPHCKKIVFVKNAKNGLDLPKKVCSCNTVMKSDGQNLSTELSKEILSEDRYNHILVAKRHKDIVINKILEKIKVYSHIVLNINEGGFNHTEIRYNPLYNQEYVDHIKYDIRQDKVNTVLYSCNNNNDNKYINYLKGSNSICIREYELLDKIDFKLNTMHYNLNNITDNIESFVENIFCYFHNIRLNSFITGYNPVKFSELVKCISLDYNTYDEAYYDYIIKTISNDYNNLNKAITSRCDLYECLISEESINEYKKIVKDITNYIRKGQSLDYLSSIISDISIFTDKIDSLNKIECIKFLVYKSRVIDDLILMLL